MRYDNQTIREIEKKLGIIRQCPEYHLLRGNSLIHELRQKDMLLSYLMEHPEYRNLSLRRGHTRIIRKGVKRLSRGFDYLKKNFPNLVESFEAEDLIKLGEIVDPNNNGFRTVRVSLNLPNYTPPNPIKVPELTDKLFGDVQADDLHPIERAALFHLGIAAIQPFLDGNKRIARLLQNKVLDEQELPPASIPLGERQFYIGLLERSMRAYREGDVIHQGPFLNYIAAKTNVALDIILENLRERDLCGDCLVSYSFKGNKKNRMQKL